MKRLIARAPRSARPFRLRLIDAVTLAAGGLLVLKLAGFALEGPPAKSPDAEAWAEPLPPFARILAYARSNEPLDPAMTGSVTPKEEPKEAKPAEPPAPPSAAASAMNGAVPPSPSERALLERLGERRDALQQRTRDLDVRERLLENAERRLEGRVGDLKTLEVKAEAANPKRNEGEAALKPLVTMYETMKPKEAARVFDRLNLEVLVPVVLQMNPRKMAEVLAAMQPETAEKLTVALATRARGTPDVKAGGVMPANELPAIEQPKSGH